MDISADEPQARITYHLREATRITYHRNEARTHFRKGGQKSSY